MFEDDSFKRFLYFVGWFLALVCNPLIIYIAIKVGFKDPQSGSISLSKYWTQVAMIVIFSYSVACYCIYAYGEKKIKNKHKVTFKDDWYKKE